MAATLTKTKKNAAPADKQHYENAALLAAISRAQAVIEFEMDGTIVTANENFLDLQRQLADIEGQLAFSRQYYNDSVAALNNLTQTIPWMFLTGLAGVDKREFYDAPAGQEAPPQVSF